MTDTDFAPTREALMAVYTALYQAYGDQAWWPAQDDFEVAVGAVLTQNTNWGNVERAIVNLRSAECLSLSRILALTPEQLAELIRPAGYYNVKAQRLLNLCRYLQQQGGLKALRAQPLNVARTGLLSVNGIGPETADDILLYALDHPVFVIDTYTRRLLQRLQLASGEESYETLRAGFEHALPADKQLFGQFHALIVRHAKVACRKRPCCDACCVRNTCPQAHEVSP